MSSSPGFLEFFVLEAGEYVEQLDGLLVAGGASGPDAAAMQRLARALRGTATMAKLPSFADLAGALERVGRSLADGAASWNASLNGAVVAAVDDLKLLLRAARSWSPAEDQRAAARVAELRQFTPNMTPAAARPSVAGSGSGSAFLAGEATNIAAGLELLAARPADLQTAVNLLRRVRALRGVAGVKEIVPLTEALEATEDATRGLELRHEPLTATARALLEAAAAFLRQLASAVRDGAATNAT